MDIFFPEVEDFFTIVYFHGGGLVEGDKGDSHEFVKHLTKLGFAVATANYSLLTERNFQNVLRTLLMQLNMLKTILKAKVF